MFHYLLDIFLVVFSRFLLYCIAHGS